MSVTNREVAHRIFAAEYDDATHSYSESDEERAPNYVVTPTGARVNRLFVVGVLTEVEQVSDEVLRARIADPTGAFVLYAGQYQPDEKAFLERADPPMFVAVTGKARTFSPDDADRIYTSVRPETITEVDAATRDRWTVGAAEQTLARVATAAAALDLDAEGDALEAALRESGVPVGLAAGIPRAFAEYGTTEHYLAGMADVAVEALGLVADEVAEVTAPSVAPADAGDGTVDAAGIAAGVDAAVVDLVPPEAVEAEAAMAEEATDSDAPGGGGTATDADAPPEGAADADDAPEEDTTGGEGEADAASGGDDTSEAPSPEDEEAESADSDAEADDDTAGSADDLGDFEPAGDEPDSEPSATPDEDVATGDGPDDVLDDEERERIESEFGTDFSTGAEVDEPGAADIEPEAGAIEPERDDAPDGEAASDEDAAAASPSEQDEAGVTDEPAAASTDADGAGPAEDDAADDGTDEADAGDDVDLEAAVVEAMTDLDDGDGADREAVVAAVVDDHGVDPGAAEDAIQDALMAGKCYEPADGRVKAI